MSRAKMRVVTNPSHPRETVQRAYDLSAEGISYRRIADQLGLPRETVRYWLSNPDYSPTIDEVALERALEGDADAIAGLTVWERIEFYKILPGLAEQWSSERESSTAVGEGSERFGPVLWERLMNTARLRAAKSA